MRQVVLDTETTGLEPAEGHRILEIGCVEIVDRHLTGNNFHQYLQPDRPIDRAAEEVHGITDEFLKDKPRFGDIADDFLAYIRGAELIIHNAPFDLGFLDNELSLCERDDQAVRDLCNITDTLAMARDLYPGQRNSLDALCKRFGVDNTRRDLHGALLDAEILADVYLAMTGGQASLAFDTRSGAERGRVREDLQRIPWPRPPLSVVRADEEDLAAHLARLKAIDKASGGRCLWLRKQSTPEPVVPAGAQV